MVHVLSFLWFYGLITIQHNEFSISIHDDGKVNAIEPYALSKQPKRQTKEALNAKESKSFMCINASIKCLAF